MTAKEMFEKLGYHENDRPYRDSPIGYFRRIEYKHYIEILFLLSEKRVVYSSTSSINDCISITMPDLKAIQKQCKELGWLEEDDNN